MPSPNRKRYRLAQIVQEVRETKTGFEIEGEDGSVTVVPPPELWPDEAMTLANTDPVAAAKLLLGEEQYAAFKASGGSAGLLFHIIQQETGSTPGESTAS